MTVSSSNPAAGATQARLFIVTAAVLWSLSALFAKALHNPTIFAVSEPTLDVMQIAFYRVLFAGAVLTLTLHPGAFTYRRPMIAMVGCFAIMNGLFISAMTLGQAVNAILLQYVAPLWIVLGSVIFLGERFDRRNLLLVVVGVLGVGVILYGNWAEANPAVLAMAIGSGVFYAGVLICLRALNRESPGWLTVLNFLGSAVLLFPFANHEVAPTVRQLVWLFLFGSVQMALPYWLMARGLKHVSPQEAGMLTLIEPVLNPLWAFLLAPETETPNAWTIAGGALILSALAWRYWPSRNRPK